MMRGFLPFHQARGVKLFNRIELFGGYNTLRLESRTQCVTVT